MKLFESTIKRQSSFELLRLISMLMIVMGHFLIRIDIAGYFHPYNPTITNILLTTLYSMMVIGVNLFVMITGYFGIHKIVTPCLRLITDCAIYGGIALIIRNCLFGAPPGFELKDIIGGGC